ncbi:hypothetical protein PQJ75_00990 [Rhodoplanes sp. TEM]|uniref:Uncharacterized protein n=1 Tax=Rhodoplanes tepidamans TaxID=200616 RepID=A0ABT5J5C0_RHOTP|nr:MULTISPECIES: hypothetical protein [Rhodoplanes]MDC7784829.1 hypothetical protein [Rhodoplanes tepidamans]MDC7982296.1 hypothetical protein [Rhodoplanes sp. TEM]MDQ0356304.1 hypothetical protein [Rhodoplanes tepidamans]
MNIVNTRLIPTVTQKDIDALLEVGGRAIHAEFLRGANSKRDPSERWDTAPLTVRESFIREFGAAVNAITAAGWEIRRKR